MRSKTSSFKSNDKNTNKLEGISKSKVERNKLEEIYNCLNGVEYQRECDKYVICSINQGIYLTKVTKSSQSAPDENRCYLNQTESKPWNLESGSWTVCFIRMRFSSLLCL